MSVTGDADLAQLLSMVAHRVTKRLVALLAEQDSSIDEWRVLSLLSDRDGQSMSQIAEFSMLPAPTLTKVIDRMVAANLVYRRGDARDRRRVLVHLAPRGTATFARLQTAVRAEQDRRDALLSETVDPALLAQILSDVLAQLDGRGDTQIGDIV